ncbi:MAG: alanine dehydrogenase [Methanothrix sp.]|nr:alanine dehydrogenase [Methanothrix sp.]MDD3710269.1 alanine dehydrogenase [Methanothrix sp.]MDD5767222.1 alanine dehydrogenase [Methanothrix sp.]
MWLSEEEVKASLTIEETIEAVEEAFREHGLGTAQMPPKSYLYYKKYDGDLRTMPAYLEEMDATGVKVVNVHPANSGLGLPTVMAVVILNSPKTGAPLAIMGGTHLTNMRTGAAGAVAAKFLARKDSRRVGLVGAGAQARTQLMGLVKTFEIETVKVADVSLDRCMALERDCRSFLDVEYHLSTDVKEVCNCDILVTTTPSRKPLVKDEWIVEGTHINAIGADAKGKEELDPAILKRSKVVVDDLAQASHSGEVNVPLTRGLFSIEEIWASIGEVIAGKVPGRESEEEITVFDSTGLAIQDVATARKVHHKALEMGIGTKLPFL